ncbi:MAG: UvrD-helicase domain-containing protein, partial [Nocardia sp.]|nr:UvrD-helicase domain-containing protein [Nocardia sp.]
AALALAAVADRRARLVPGPELGDHPDAEPAAFAEAVRAEVDRRKRLAGIRDFDDQLVLLHEVLADPVHGEAACRRIRERFRITLVDEFQDTDPLQWDILRRAFHTHTTLVLVGDPKQAIYAFRGAEVFSYLEAVAHAGDRRELDTNRRSDANLITALGHLLCGAALGHPDITVAPVRAVCPPSRLTGPAEAVVPLRLRCFPRQGAGPLNGSGFPAVARQRDRIVTDLAAQIALLLTSGVRFRERELGPQDIAVLVRTRAQTDLVRAALDRAGVPAVLAGGASVFATQSATDWLWVLRALEQPHRADRVRLAATTPLIGLTAADIDSGGADLVGRLSTRLREVGRIFARAGFAAVFDRLGAVSELAPRLLAERGGERRLTDLRHIAELLDEVAARESLGLTALTRWLADRVRDPASGTVSGRSRRLEHGAAAVQIATVHASKGLEFPVVFLPFAWDGSKHPNPATLLFHDGGDRVLDVGGPDAPGYADRRRAAEAEEAGEELRLLYVALTRAQCQVVAWWAPTYGTAVSPLHRMLLGRTPGQPEIRARTPVPADPDALRHFQEWAVQAGPGMISVEPLRGPAIAPDLGAGRDAPVAEPAAAIFTRQIDHDWRRTSYSALTAAAHDSAPVADPDEPDGDGTVTDEPSSPTAESAAGHEDAAPSLMNDLPYGAEFGTLVHGVLEHIDTDAPDLAAEVRMRCDQAISQLMADIDPDVLSRALHQVLLTPIDPVALADIRSRDRLAELDFELPLAGGDDPVARRVSVRAIAEQLRRHLPAGDPFTEYPDALEQLEDVPLRGYLTGSIDAVLRTAGPRFLIVDYKTNRLAPDHLTVAHYRREAMAQEMMRSHYPLQALLYAVALHRYLRWRLPGYEPGTHLGGVRYLFVRGMIGPATPPGCGVFDWNPPAALVVSLSRLLAGEDPR